MIFDTHAHYDDSTFDEDRSELLLSLSSGLIINPGCDIKSSLKAMELADSYEFVYFAAGIHPEELADLSPDFLQYLAEFLNHPKCVACGEIGLDYYWDKSQKELQKQVFEKQIQLAVELNKPVIIHDREAHQDCLDMVKKYEGLSGVFHCFSGSREMAAILLEKGLYLGFDGPVTYKNARKILEVLEICPLDKILIETDSPYMSPVPLRGTRNNSGNLSYVIEKIAEIKGCSNSEIEEITYNNAKTLFNI